MSPIWTIGPLKRTEGPLVNRAGWTAKDDNTIAEAHLDDMMATTLAKPLVRGPTARTILAITHITLTA